MLEYLKSHGFVVVKGAATAKDIDAAKDLLWEFLEEETGMRRAEAPTTWTNSNFKAVGDPVNGIVNGNGFGHSRFCWFVRTLPAVRASFASIWGTEKLVSSFDGGNVFRPYHIGGADGPSHRTLGGWWHVDQGRTKRGLHAVQGLVSLYDATARTGGLCVVPGSHRTHADLMSYAAMNDNDYVAVPEPTLNPVLQGARLVTCKAGDLLLWDSRTIHCNTPAPDPLSATERLPGEADALLRAVCYVCMTPRRWASRATLRARRAAFAAGIGSTHWPHEFRPLAPPESLEMVDPTRVESVLEECDRHVRELV